MRALLLFVTMIVAGQQAALAQVNPELVDMLNRIRAQELKAQLQCQAHDQRFSAAVVYQRILSEKADVLSSLERVIIDIGGEIGKAVMPTETYHDYLQALNADAASEIAVIAGCDQLLETSGHPRVRQVVQAARNRAFEHFLILSNTAQKQLVDAQVREPLLK